MLKHIGVEWNGIGIDCTTRARCDLHSEEPKRCRPTSNSNPPKVDDGRTPDGRTRMRTDPLKVALRRLYSLKRNRGSLLVRSRVDNS